MLESNDSKCETDVHFAAIVKAKFQLEYREGGKQLIRSMRTRLTLDLHKFDWQMKQSRDGTINFA